MIITFRDARRLEMCRSGIKNFCDRYGLDYHKLRSEGLPEEDFAATGDAMAETLIKETKRGRSE